LPVILVVGVALIIALGFIVHGITRPCRRPYLVTPQSFTGISGRVLKVTDETWQNRDGTRARGWLLKGAEGAPAVVLLHKYCADRSWLFNLGIKLNEATNFTILWPDMRGHGVDPPTATTTFGNKEAEDLAAALDYLRTLKGDTQNHLVADRFGVYGVELGAYTAMRGASKDPRIQALALDSVPTDADALVNAAVREEVGINNVVLLKLARMATHIYSLGAFENTASCEVARGFQNQRVLLLAGAETGQLRESTVSLQSCFPNPANVEVKTDLPLTGFTLTSATGEQGERYDRPVIEFFLKSLH
jgi:pimeloyl-ACP methyl ester carboxylesterase